MKKLSLPLFIQRQLQSMSFVTILLVLAVLILGIQLNPEIREGAKTILSTFGLVQLIRLGVVVVVSLLIVQFLIIYSLRSHKMTSTMVSLVVTLFVSYIFNVVLMIAVLFVQNFFG